MVDVQYGGSPVKVGDEEYSLFRDHELVSRSSDYMLNADTFQVVGKDQRIKLMLLILVLYEILQYLSEL